MLQITSTRMFLVAIVCALAAGCTGGEVPIEDMTATEIYQTAEEQLANEDLQAAATTFKEVERLYPFSQLAKRAVIMSAYSSYKAGLPEEARLSAHRYLDLYPSDDDAAYAQYLVALTYYDNISDVGRDQVATRNALIELQEVVRRYPDSDFARDAQFKMDLTNDHLAAKEMDIGRYYLKRGHFPAAINRFRTVIEKYQTTNQTPEALHRLVEANLALGLEQEAIEAAAVLGHNFKGSDWYANSYALLTGRNLLPEDEEEIDGFFSQTYRQIIQGKWL